MVPGRIEWPAGRVGHDEPAGQTRGARLGLFPGGVSELEQLAMDIAACESRLTRLHESIGAVLDGQPTTPL